MVELIDELIRYLFTCLFTYPLTNCSLSLTHSLFHLPTYLPTYLPPSLPPFLTHLPTHSLTHSLIYILKQISLEGPNQDIMMMETQHRDEAKKKTVAFRVPARGKLGTQLLDFLAVCEGREDRAGMPVSEFWVLLLFSSLLYGCINLAFLFLFSFFFFFFLSFHFSFSYLVSFILFFRHPLFLFPPPHPLMSSNERLYVIAIRCTLADSRQSGPAPGSRGPVPADRVGGRGLGGAGVGVA